jgi:hypothetical protein
VTQLDGNEYQLTVGELPSTPCSITGNGTAIETWPFQFDAFIFNQEAEEQLSVQQLYYVGQDFEAIAPSKYGHIRSLSDGLQTYFIVEPTLPEGLSLSEASGLVSGSFEAPSSKSNYSISLYDPLTRQSKVIWTIENLEVLIPPVSQSSTLSPAAYAVPVGVFLVIALIVYWYFRNDRKKEYHIFISYRGLNPALFCFCRYISFSCH